MQTVANLASNTSLLGACLAMLRADEHEGRAPQRTQFRARLTEGLERHRRTLDMPVLNETASPERYGAIGDGVTDDTAALQVAVNAYSKIPRFLGAA